MSHDSPQEFEIRGASAQTVLGACVVGGFLALYGGLLGGELRPPFIFIGGLAVLLTIKAALTTLAVVRPDGIEVVRLALLYREVGRTFYPWNSIDKITSERAGLFGLRICLYCGEKVIFSLLEANSGRDGLFRCVSQHVDASRMDATTQAFVLRVAAKRGYPLWQSIAVVILSLVAMIVLWRCLSK